jgi:branched-chain amino acid transport system permease protein
MLGALVIGLATEISASFIVSDYKDVVAFVILIAMLTVRPNGLLGARA